MEDMTLAVSPIAEAADGNAAAQTPSATIPAAEGGDGGLWVVFNRQQRHLSPEEAVRYAQQGLKWEQFAPEYRKLRFLSEQLGGGVGEMADQLLSCWEKEEWEALSAAHPDEPHKAAQLFAAAKSQREQQWGEAPAAPTAEERLAEEYALADLPAELWRVAEAEEVPLLDAYLRVLYREQRRVQEAQAQAAQAASRSAGSMQGVPETPDTAGAAFLQALARAV